MSAAVRFDQQMARVAAGMLETAISKDLRTRYRQLPVMVRTSGLAATYAYLVGKADTTSDIGRAYGKVADGIRQRFNNLHLVSPQVDDNMRLLAKLGDLSTADYMRATADVEALAGWLSRLADARFQAALAVSGSGQENPEAAS